MQHKKESWPMVSPCGNSKKDKRCIEKTKSHSVIKETGILNKNTLP